MSQPNEHNDFSPTCPISNLRKRARLLQTLRRFFDEQGFFEVETPILSADVVVDRHIEPIPVTALNCHTSRSPLWLQTSPEFAMKRLLSAGADKIYQITKAFRNAERGDQHNPEFTMLEWYRVGDNYQQGRALLADFARHVFDTQTVQQISYQDAFRHVLGICPHSLPLDELLNLAHQKVNTTLSPQDGRDEVLNVLLSELIEPTLGIQSPTIVFDFPASQSALARIRKESPPVAERFELYFRGVEIANGYHELTDPQELRVRNERVNRERVGDGKPGLPVESRLLDAMRSGLPACCGVAVGVDRLAMLLLATDRIDDVIAFPIESA